jgi:predicted permease
MLWRDVRYALRMLRKTPVVTCVSILSLTLGIGANTAIFSLIDALELRSLPVRAPQELVAISMAGPDGHERPLSLRMFQELRREQKAFSSVFAWIGGGIDNLEADGIPYSGSMNNVSGEYFPTLGVKPLLGRFFGPADVSLDHGWAAKVAVLDYRCWRQRYHSDPNVVGKNIRIENHSLQIIGVTPEEFNGLYIDGQFDVTAPLGYSGRLAAIDPSSFWFDYVIGRLKPGVSATQARAEMDTLWPQLLGHSASVGYTPSERARFLASKPVLQSAERGFSFQRARVARPLAVLMCLVAMLLLIACANLANLMLARSWARQHEFAIRLALGADRWRLARQSLIESLLLSLSGAALGTVLAMWSSSLLARMFWRGLVPLALNTKPDARVLLFTIGVAVFTAFLFGSAPVWKLRQADPAVTLARNSRGIRGRSRRFGHVLVSSQLALSLMLIIGGTLFVRSVLNLQTYNAGFQRDGVLTVSLVPKAGIRDFPNKPAYYRLLTERLLHIPGVQMASYSNNGPGAGAEYPTQVETSSGNATRAVTDSVAPGFFDLLGMHVLAGRSFTWQDDDHVPRVAMLSDSLAKRLFPDRDAIGQTVLMNNSDGTTKFSVVGVVNSASLWSLRSHEPEALYLAALQEADFASPMLDMRVNGNPLAVMPQVRKSLEQSGVHYPLIVETLRQREDRFLTEDRVVASLSAILAGLAALLAAVGLYGLLSYSVSRRTSEIGTRMALGADRAGIVRMVLREVLWLALPGAAAGIASALALGRLIASMIYGISENDPLTLVLSTVFLVTIALMAGYFPARAAARIDPMEALRTE